HISLCVIQGWIQLVFAAEVDHLEGFQQFRKDFPDRVVDCHRSETSADYQNHRFIGGKSAEVQGCQFTAPEKFFPDGRSCDNRLVSRKAGDSLRKITADS